jgi:hypothetical protein
MMLLPPPGSLGSPALPFFTNSDCPRGPLWSCMGGLAGIQHSVVVILSCSTLAVRNFPPAKVELQRHHGQAFPLCDADQSILVCIGDHPRICLSSKCR